MIRWIALLAMLPVAALAQSTPNPTRTGTSISGVPNSVLSPADILGAFATKADYQWALNHLNRHRSVEDYSPAGDCATDDTAKFVQAMNAVVADGGGELEIGPKCYAVSGLTVPSKVKLVGHWYEGSQSYGSYISAPYTLALNPSSPLSLSANSAIEGMIIIRQGLTLPTNIRSAVNMLNAFSGTAIIPAPNALDVSIRHLAIFGFAKAIDMPNVNERITIEDVIGDNSSGITVNNSHDISRVSNVHFWPFLTANFPWSANAQQIVTNAVSSSGLVKLSTAAAHGLVTGDTVVVHDVAGVPAANGRWVVTVIDATNITLQGTTFAGTFGASPSSGVGIDILRRTGTAFEVLNSETISITNSFSYDYTTGFHIGTGAGWTQMIGNSADGQFFLKDPSTTGVLVDGTSYATSIVGGSFQACGVAMTLNSTGTTGTIVTGATINPGASLQTYSIQVLQGRATFSGNQSTLNISTNFQVADAISSLILSGNDFPTWAVVASTAATGNMTGFGNSFGAGTPSFGSLVVSNVTAGQFVNSVAPVGFTAIGNSASNSAPVFQQRVYVANSNVGGGISINGHAVGADAIVFNGSANAILIYINNGAGTINGSISFSLAAGAVMRMTTLATNSWTIW